MTRRSKADEVARIRRRYKALGPVLNERTRRLWAAAEAALREAAARVSFDLAPLVPLLRRSGSIWLH